MKAKAAVMREAHAPLTIEEIEIDKPARREVLVRTVFAGVCHSDLHFIEGYDYDELCAILSISYSNCRTLMSRAKESLRKKLAAVTA